MIADWGDESREARNIYRGTSSIGPNRNLTRTKCVRSKASASPDRQIDRSINWIAEISCFDQRDMGLSEPNWSMYYYVILSLIYTSYEFLWISYIPWIKCRHHMPLASAWLRIQIPLWRSRLNFMWPIVSLPLRRLLWILSSIISNLIWCTDIRAPTAVEIYHWSLAGDRLSICYRYV